QGQSVESCLIGNWHKKKGDAVSVGDLLFTYETDKATFEEEATVSGILLDIFFEEGDDVECLVNVCVIGEEGESTEEFRPKGASGVGAEVSATPQQSVNETSPSSQQQASVIQNDSSQVSTISVASMSPVTQMSADASGDSFVRISPRAKALAEKTRADLGHATPTGPSGRIIERDVQAVLSSGHRGETSGVAQSGYSFGADDSTRKVITPDSEEVGLSNVRKFIAKAMHASLANSAQLTHHSSFDATDVLNFRKNLKTIGDNDAVAKITITDIITYAVSRVILKHKNMNAHYLGDSMKLFNNAHIGVAVDTPRGLLVPTVSNANALSLSQLSLQAKELFEMSKQGSVPPDKLKGASFTISNLGNMGVEMFTPVINPPQTGILGVCAIIERTKNGVFYPAMGLSLTYDHQALDGADAARFMKDLVAYLEKFSFNLALEGV
ncbi:MAG: 2-oxo acid dehydrogenase subunit E2, partial [Oscillospiraceae bacterium]|nr:2-oxo acid dehydrogenase subunit E2 [Oscillospiraceae bacterium]